MARYGKAAEWAGKIAKGDVVFASGTPEVEEWEGKDGGKRQTLKLIASEIVGMGKWQKAERDDKQKPMEGLPDDLIPF